MAENKKGFLLYADYEELFEELSDIDAGQLIKHILRYVNDRNPESDNSIVKISFIPIKRQLKRDLESYENKREQWSEAGKRSAEARRKKKEQTLKTVPTDLTTVENVATDSTVNVNVNVNDINKIDYQALLDVICKSFQRKFKLINKTVRNSYEARLKEGYTKTDILHAIKNCKNDPYHKDKNYQYCTPEFFSRSSTLDKYSDVTTQKKVIVASHPLIID